MAKKKTTDVPEAEIVLNQDYKVLNKEGKLPKLSFSGYSGDTVDLRDYGFDAPVVYNIATMTISKKTPILYNHEKEIGHTTQLIKANNGTAVTGYGVLSIPNAQSNEVREGLSNEFPYQASMGLKGTRDNISYLAKGTAVINGRTFKAPIYIWDNTRLREMTLTAFGRDSDTFFELLNEEMRMKIKNATLPKNVDLDDEDVDNKEVENEQTEEKEEEDKKTVKNSKKPVKKTAPKRTLKKPVVVVKNEDEDVDNEEEDSDDVLNEEDFQNEDKPLTRRELSLIMNRTAKHKDHPELVYESVLNGWSDMELEDRIELQAIRKARPKPPRRGESEQLSNSDFLRARLYTSLGVQEETILKNFDKRIAERALDAGEIGLKEFLVTVANAHGGHFNGHSDVKPMTKYIKNLVLNSAMSTIDMPEFFSGAGATMLDEMWTIDPPFAPSIIQWKSMSNFKPTKTLRAGGGKMWERVGEDGKLKHAEFGDTYKYYNYLSTIGQFVQYSREMVENDDMSVIADLMTLMLEGAIMVPDCKLINDLNTDDDDFWVDGVNSFSGADAALTRANLSTHYNNIRKLAISKGSKAVRNIQNMKWKLVCGVEYEETAWDIINQERIVQETGAASGTRTGDKNYWFKRLNVVTFAQIGNQALMNEGLTTRETDWYLIPEGSRHAAYTMSTLRGRKKPIIEDVPAPSDVLAFATRGYWDTELNRRDNTSIYRLRPDLE